MQQHLGVAVDSPVELVVGVGRIIQGELMGDQQGGRGPAGDDQVAQGLVVPLDRALAGADPLALLEQGAEVEADPALPGSLGSGLGVLRT
jgi:hypothetical protein